MPVKCICLENRGHRTAQDLAKQKKEPPLEEAITQAKSHHTRGVDEIRREGSFSQGISALII
jgi:hypothetical protein